MYQGGAGTSANMNANEVLANVALELSGHKKGEYNIIEPHDDLGGGIWGSLPTMHIRRP